MNNKSNDKPFADDYTIEKSLMHQAIENATIIGGGSAFSVSVINEMLAKNDLNLDAINALIEHAEGILGNAKSQIKVYGSMLELLNMDKQDEIVAPETKIIENSLDVPTA